MNTGSILLVDDNRIVLQMLEVMLRERGYEVEIVTSGKQALERAPEQPPELILLDISMPDLDGYEVCRRLKASPATRSIPVIFISGRGAVLDKVAAFKAGGVDYVTKPFHVEEVLARVESQLQLARLRHALEERNAELERKNEELLRSRRKIDQVFSALAEVLPGTLLDGKYRLESKIGAGGFGAVYRALHLDLNRPVAVKIFRPAAGSEALEPALERFRLEGISACRVDHPNAVSVLDAGISSSGIAYLVMELLKGKTLAEELCTEEQLSLARCAEIVVPICQVLQVADAAGVVHRDIKPENIFLHRKSGKEIVKVVDFGIAKLLGDQTEGGDTGVLSTAGLVGTATYMAPERLLNEPYDGRSDLYSVGVMLYVMLSGVTPFQAKGRNLRLLAEICHGTPIPLGEVAPDVSPEIGALVMRMLSKDPAARLSAAELAVALSAAVDAPVSS